MRPGGIKVKMTDYGLREGADSRKRIYYLLATNRRTQNYSLGIQE
jgi:hypothetical protein